LDVLHETEDLGPDFASTFLRLKWECLEYGVSLDIFQYPFPKPDIYRHLKGGLTLKQMCANMMTIKRNRFKKLVKQETFCSLPFEDYESMTPTQQFSFEKALETERIWSNFNLEVCHICQGCHLGTMKRTIVELGHSGERETMQYVIPVPIIKSITQVKIELSRTGLTNMNHELLMYPRS
jgi:hypothetical protein